MPWIQHSARARSFGTLQPAKQLNKSWQRHRVIHVTQCHNYHCLFSFEFNDFEIGFSYASPDQLGEMHAGHTDLKIREWVDMRVSRFCISGCLWGVPCQFHVCLCWNRPKMSKDAQCRIWQIEDLSTPFTSAPSHGLGGRPVVLNMRRQERLGDAPDRHTKLEHCGILNILIIFNRIYLITFIIDVFEKIESVWCIAAEHCKVHRSELSNAVTKASNHRRSASRCGTRRRRRLDHFFPPLNVLCSQPLATFSY